MRILIIGNKGSGKTTLGNYIAEEIGCPHVNIADSLKKILSEGVGVPENYMSDPNLKDTVTWSNFSVRKIMQNTGAAIRSIDPLFLLNAWSRSTKNKRHVVVSDVRLKAEYDYISHSHRGRTVLVYVTSPDGKDVDTDITEQDWKSLIPHAHHVVVNDKQWGRGKLKIAAEEIVEELMA